MVEEAISDMSSSARPMMLTSRFTVEESGTPLSYSAISVLPTVREEYRQGQLDWRWRLGHGGER